MAEPTHPHSSLQQLIDEGARTGQVVEIPAGVHVLEDSLHLRSGLHLVAHPDAIITRAPSVSSPVADFLGYGLYDISVTEPDKFRIGMGVHLYDDNSGGFYTTVATIIGKDGERFLIDRPLAHDYLPASNGTAANLFPLISGINVNDVVLENLILDGNSSKVANLNGCRGGGVFLLGSQRVRMKNLEVRNYNGDAISFQQCTDIEVRDCEIHHNKGSGLHPGSGSVRYVFSNNHVHHNSGDGIFYCLRTTHSLCENNRFENNARVGISIGERDTDHILRGNIIQNNAGAGIHFREALKNGADRVRVEKNTIGANCVQSGAAEIEIESGLREIVILENQIIAENCPAFVVADNCEEIYFAQNSINDQAQSESTLCDAASVAAFDEPANFPAVGPEALSPEGARHLNREVLQPFPFS